MQLRALFVLVLSVVSCRESTTGPQQPRIALSVVGETVVHAAPGAMLPVPLRVVTRNAATSVPISGVTVEWRVTQGSAALAHASSTSDEYGVAAVPVTAGQTGSARITATTARIQGTAPQIELVTVPRGVITSFEPAIIAAGSEVVINGQHFSTSAHDNVVLFDGVRGSVLSATPTSLRVAVPVCLPTRSVAVQAGVGYAVSTPALLGVTEAGDGGSVSLMPGEVRTLSTPAELACIRLDAPAGAQHLLIARNAASVIGPPQWLELRALAATGTIAELSQTAGAVNFADTWEAALRTRERQLPPAAPGDALPHVRAAPATVPTVGERRSFNVYNTSNTFDKITAEVRTVTSRAVIYVDVAALNVFSAANLQVFGDLFDDPIYPTMVDIFGQPSDVDGNGRVLILFTPTVNRMTPKGSSSFVAGFFYGCDLVSRSRCSGTNDAEIFYSMMPDPSGEWGDPRSLATVMRSVPPVLAHEFQHMIHFARRGFSADVLWLSEGLAHTAEELTGEVFAARGDANLANAFQSGNTARARMYLAATASTSLVSLEPPGSLDVRGGAWLFLKYLRGHYGENELLGRLTSSTRTGADNVVAEVGRPWDALLEDFAVASWAHGAPELAGPLAVEHTFNGFDPRVQLSSAGGHYPLQPTVLPWSDLASSFVLPPASHSYSLIQTPSTAPPSLGFVLANSYGVPVAAGSDVRLTVLRVR